MEPTNQDHYLVIESTIDGEVGSFVGSITVRDNKYKDQDGNQINRHVEKSESFSTKAVDDIHLEIFDEEVYLKGGKLKPLIDNIKTQSGENRFVEYKDKLDQFAKALSDLSYSYIEHDDGTYIYGKNATLFISRLFHSLTILFWIFFAIEAEVGFFTYLAIFISAIILFFEHKIILKDFTKIDQAFYTLNGYLGIMFFIMIVIDYGF